MKTAAIQMRARCADVAANMEKAEKLVKEAFFKGAKWVILPEFFTSGMAFHPKMKKAWQPADGAPFKMLMALAKKHNGVVGGSFLAKVQSDVVNRFILAFSDGRFFYHDKDQPTMWENCYYVGGNDKGIIDTGEYRVGAALCWELVRTRTAGRLLGKVDFVVGGSCWWGLPKKKVPGFPMRLQGQMLDIMKDTPKTMACILGVPLVHAAHAGEFTGRMPLMPGFPFQSYLVGETMIVDARGNILAHMAREEGDGSIVAEINPGAIEAKLPVPEGFWIPKLPWQLKMIWAYQNFHGRYYYKLTGASRQ